MLKINLEVDERTEQILRFSGLAVPFLLTIYGILIQYHVILSSYYISHTVFFTLMSIWILIGSIQFLYPPKSRLGAIIRIGTYHVFGALYLLLVSGFSTPFVASWIILFLATLTFFNDLGLKISIVIFIITAIIDSLIHNDNPDIFINNSLSVLAILIVGLSISVIWRMQNAEIERLSKKSAKSEIKSNSVFTLINNLSEAILSTDKNGNIIIYNNSLLNLLEKNDDLTGKKIDEVLTIYDKQDKPLNILELLKQSQGINKNDDLGLTIKGEDLNIEMTYSSIQSDNNNQNETNGYLIIIKDITKAKSLEDERDEFISVVGHELRTPIAVAEGSISNSLLMLKKKKMNDDLIIKSIKTSQNQIAFLSKMINDLSALSGVNNGVADAAELIDVEKFIHSIYNEYTEEAAEKGLKFDIDISGKLGRIFVSKMYLHQLIQNLVTNAIKYTKTGTVTLRARLINDIVHFAVEDTGIGISKTDQKKIFDKFYRSEDYRTRETSGAGLGLFISVKLARKLGCRISVESRINHGSTFSFNLPKADN